MTSILLAFYLADALWLTPSVLPSHLFTLMKSGALRRGDLKEASSQQLMRSWCLSPTTQEKLNSANSYISELERGSFLVKPGDNCSRGETQSQRIPLRHAWSPDLQELWVCSKGYFKPLHVRAIYYAATDNTCC